MARSDWTMTSTHFDLDHASACHWNPQEWHWSHHWYHKLTPFIVLNSSNLCKTLKRWMMNNKNGVFYWENTPLNSQKWSSRMVPMTSTYQFQGWNIFLISDQPIHDKLYCSQANNCQLLHMKVTSFPSWFLPMLCWFYVQDLYLSCSRTILGSSFHSQEANDTIKVHGYS